MDLLRHWVGVHKSGDTEVTGSESEAEAWRKAGWRVDGPFVLESSTTQGAVSLLNDMAECAAAAQDAGENMRATWVTGRVQGVLRALGGGQ